MQNPIKLLRNPRSCQWRKMNFVKPKQRKSLQKWKLTENLWNEIKSENAATNETSPRVSPCHRCGAYITVYFQIIYCSAPFRNWMFQDDYQGAEVIKVWEFIKTHARGDRNSCHRHRVFIDSITRVYSDLWTLNGRQHTDGRGSFIIKGSIRFVACLGSTFTHISGKGEVWGQGADRWETCRAWRSWQEITPTFDVGVALIEQLTRSRNR